MTAPGISDFNLFCAAPLLDAAPDPETALIAGRTPRVMSWLARSVGAAFAALGAKLALICP